MIKAKIKIKRPTFLWQTQIQTIQYGLRDTVCPINNCIFSKAHYSYKNYPISKISSLVVGNREPESKHCSTLRVEYGRNGSARAAWVLAVLDCKQADFGLPIGDEG